VVNEVTKKKKKDILVSPSKLMIISQKDNEEYVGNVIMSEGIYNWELITYSSCKIIIGIVEELPSNSVSEKKPRSFMHLFSSSTGRSIAIKLDFNHLTLETKPYGLTKPNKKIIIQSGRWRFKMIV